MRRRTLQRIGTRIKKLYQRLGIDRETALTLRALPTLGTVLGLTLVVSAVVFPQLPARTLALFPVYAHLLDAYVVSEQLFTLLLGVSLLVISTLLHVSLDAYADTVGVPWQFAGTTYLQLLVLASFTGAFVVARTLVVYSGIVGPETATGTAGFIPVNEVWLYGYHVHHFFFGFLAVAVAGWLLLFRDDPAKKRLAVLYGAGLGIFVDEIGMLLTEGDYFTSASYFVAVTLTGLLLAGIHWDRLAAEDGVGLEELGNA